MTVRNRIQRTIQCDLMAGLRGVLPGYLVPKLVREIPGAAAKMPAGDPAAP